MSDEFNPRWPEMSAVAEGTRERRWYVCRREVSVR